MGSINTKTIRESNDSNNTIPADLIIDQNIEYNKSINMQILQLLLNGLGMQNLNNPYNPGYYGMINNSGINNLSLYPYSYGGFNNNLLPIKKKDTRKIKEIEFQNNIILKLINEE